MNLPTIDTSERLVHGVQIKFRDGIWYSQDVADMNGTKLLALATTTAIQRWHDETSTFETLVDNGEGLPDVDELNSQVPREQWEIGLDGQPKPPWARVFVVFLLDTADASLYTYVNSTFGAKLAWKRLIDRVSWMRALKGATVFPEIQLESRPMKTRYGVKSRPEFSVVDWRDLGGAGELANDNPPPVIEDNSAA